MLPVPPAEWASAVRAFTQFVQRSGHSQLRDPIFLGGDEADVHRIDLV